MAMNYTTLIDGKSTDGSIKNWVNRSDIPVATILTEAEAFVYERLRVREMQAYATFTFAAGASSEALPDGFLDPIEFRPNGWGYELPFYHEQKLEQLTDDAGTVQDGTPSRWSIIGETAYIDTAPTEPFAGKLLYYGTPAALSEANPTNFLTRRYPTLLRMALLGMAYQHMKDTQRSQEYLGNAVQAIESANATNELSRRGQQVPY